MSTDSSSRSANSDLNALKLDSRRKHLSNKLHTATYSIRGVEQPKKVAKAEHAALSSQKPLTSPSSISQSISRLRFWFDSV